MRLLRHHIARTLLALGLATGIGAKAQAPTHDSAPPASFVIPAWAFPTFSPPFVAAATPYDSIVLLHVPASRQAFTLARVKDRFAPPDWFPASHPRMPDIVAHGRKPAVNACGFCHLPDGRGRAENAQLAGLSADYMVRQVSDFRTGVRKGAVEDWAPSKAMHDLSLAVTDAEVAEAARYFARIRATRRVTVVEREGIPRTFQVGGLYARLPSGGTEPIGQRIIEVTEDLERHDLRDPQVGFVAYVPPGSIARGRTLAMAVGTVPVTGCAACHGPSLRGVGAVPAIAGRSPTYLFRQLVGFKTGARSSPAGAPMQLVVSSLSVDDMIAAAAFAGSRRP